MESVYRAVDPVASQTLRQLEGMATVLAALVGITYEYSNTAALMTRTFVNTLHLRGLASIGEVGLVLLAGFMLTVHAPLPAGSRNQDHHCLRCEESLVPTALPRSMCRTKQR